MVRLLRLRRTARIVLLLSICLTTLPALAQNEGNRRGARSWLRRIGRFGFHNEHERNHPDVRAAFRDLVAPTSRSTVQVLSDGVQVAMGAVVRSDGHIITKASELGDDLECHLSDGRRLAASRVAVHEPADLALLKIAAENLPAVDWSDSTPPIGSWLATVGTAETPVSIGIVSAVPREVPHQKAVLGVMLEDTSRGPAIAQVMPLSPAAASGLQAGDVIVKLDGLTLRTRQALIEAIGRRKPGERVELTVSREDDDEDSLSSINVKLGYRTKMANPEQAELMESLGGPLSDRRFGFPSVLQHDSVVRPRDCGGPVVGVDGQVVGINIARASRVASYALPADCVRPIVEKMLAGNLAQAGEEGRLETVSVEN